MPIKKFIILAFAVITLAGCATKPGKKTDRLTVETTRGLVRGYADDSVAVFKGIPYASAKRFERPLTTARWDTIMDCTHYGNISPQEKPFAHSPYNPVDTVRTMGEDCLNLNIWTSMRTDGGERPVMVWIHGGGFEYGNSHSHLSVNGKKLAQNENVVLVTINHRLGPLGFLDLSEFGDQYEASGNVGMVDIVAALWWIKDNIAAFGGDPKNVTVFGQGSGGVKVLTLMGMPMAKGLFHKAIVQSGTLEGMQQTQKTSRLVGRLTLEEAGVKSVQELAGIPFDSLNKAASRAVRRVEEMHPHKPIDRTRLAPVSGTRILPYPILSDSAMMASPNIPVIIGSTMSELLAPNPDLSSSLYENRNYHTMSREQLEENLRDRYGKNAEAVKNAFIKAYPSREIGELLNLDFRQRSLVLRIAHQLVKRGDAPVYVYMFNWISPLNDGFCMSFRGSDIPFVFNNYECADFSRAGGDEARRLARIMSRCWTAFARSGNPNNSTAPFWRRINLGEGHTMMFERDIYLDAYHDLDLMRLLEPENVKDIKLISEI